MESLRTIAISNHTSLGIKNPVPYSQIPETLVGYKFIFTGTPRSVDKAVIEGAMSGCFVLSAEEEILGMTGMLEIWQELGYSNFPQLAEQINVLSKLKGDREQALRVQLSEKAISLNEIRSTTNKILSEIC